MFLTETLKFSNYNHRIVKPVPYLDLKTFSPKKVLCVKLGLTNNKY